MFETVIHQTYPNLEIILSMMVRQISQRRSCKEFLGRDARTAMSAKKMGAYLSPNTGLKEATGDYITFIDPDDWAIEDYVEVLYRQLKKYDADVSVANYNPMTTVVAKYPDCCKRTMIIQRPLWGASNYGTTMPFRRDQRYGLGLCYDDEAL